MKKITILGCMIAALFSFAACEENGNDYDGTNYIYLSTVNDQTTIYETDETPMEVEVMLTTALAEDLTLNFVIEGREGVIELIDNPAVIAAGEKTAVIKVASLNANVLEATENYTLALDAASVLPTGVELKEKLAFVVSPMSVEALTEAQLAIIEAYKASKGIDLAKYIGVVNVSTVITGTDPDTYEPLDPKTVTGKTVITLSEDATAQNPVLKMVVNPMGIQDYMYGVLKTATVENETYWFDEYALPSYETLMKAISWDKNSEEKFFMSLDGISLTADGVEFLGEYVPDPEYPEDVYVHVPFEYSYTAYDREVEALAAGTLVHDEDWAYDATANPAFHLNNDDVTEDWYEGGNWIEASAELSAEKLVFTFCMYACPLDGDFTRVVATYTPNN